MLGDVLQVGAGAEGPFSRSRNNGYQHLWVVPEIRKGLQHLRAGRGMQRIQLVGPVQGDVSDALLLLVDNEFIGHQRSS